MDSELLRRACEVAGLEIPYCHLNGEFFEARKGAFQFDSDNPALPAYVASLLVARVRENQASRWKLASTLVDGDWRQYDTADLAMCLFAATDEQRIKAALEVLNEG